MSKVFEKSKKETKKRTRLQIKNTKLVSVMLFTTTTRNKKLDFYCSFVTKKKSQQTPNKLEEDLKKDGLLPALTKNNCQFCRNAISKLKNKTVALHAVKNNPPLLSICLHHQVFFQLGSLAKDTFLCPLTFKSVKNCCNKLYQNK